MHDLVPSDTQQLEIRFERVLELILLLLWVGVIETEEEFTLVLVGEVAVEDGGFDVTNVEVAGRFGC